jgi:hypothetical protein
MRKTLMIIAGVLLIVLLNVVAYFHMVQPAVIIPGAVPTGSTLMTWDAIMKVTASEKRNWQIPPELKIWEGKLVTFDGVLFTMPQFRQDNNYEAAILTPPSRYGCCGLQCSTKPQLMMLCLFAQPLPAWSEKTRPARVTGVLHFDARAQAWTMSELREAQVIFP